MASNDIDGGPHTLPAAPLADQPLLEHFGMTFVEAANGRAVIRAAATEGMVNAQGLVHGGLAFVMADTACAYALRSIGPPGVTHNANMTYLVGAKAGMELEAIAEVVKAGRQIASLTAQVRAGERLIAHGMFNFIRRAR